MGLCCSNQAPPPESPTGAALRKASQPTVGEAVQKNFADEYVLGKLLGKGNFSVVHLATKNQKVSGAVAAEEESYAVKKMHDSNLSDQDRVALVNEIVILRDISHENVIQFFEFFVERPNYYIVTEFIDGGELFDKIVEKEYYIEDDACKVIFTLASALEYLHLKGVVHRDLKPENILLKKRNKNQPNSVQVEDFIIKLADFGFAKKVTMTNGLVTSCGTPGYVAPEILQGQIYGKQCDLWSVGVIFYILLCGYPPFVDDGAGQKSLFNKIKSGQFAFEPSMYWSSVSDESKNLVRGLLTVDVYARTSSRKLLDDLKARSSTKEKADLRTALEELKKFQARKKWKAGFAAVTAANRMNSMISKNIQTDKQPPTK